MQSTVAAPLTPERLLFRLDWKVLRRLDGLLQGDYRTHFRGVGVDFADLREYQPDDDARLIDWNVTARLQRPHVRQYMEDRELSAWMLLDRSPSMGFGSESRSKAVVLAELVTALGRLLTRHGNRVGAVVWDNAVEQVIPPAVGRRHVLRLAREVLAPVPPSRASTDLTGLIRAGMSMIRRRSLVFLVSDFLSTSAWDRRLSHLAQRNEVIALRIVDPLEVQLPDAGLIVLQDAETGEQMVVDTSDPDLRRRFAGAVEERERRLELGFRRAGVEAHTISTGEDLLGALVRITARRASGRR
ncbi:MAG: DUF58 domain-containing protein [Dehalococcoidia bacterium]|nr:DUF58 domain-containing protein [Dehalococcoidia bacterium]